MRKARPRGTARTVGAHGRRRSGPERLPSADPVRPDSRCGDGRRRRARVIVTARDRIATSRVFVGGISTRVLTVDGDGPPIQLCSPRTPVSSGRRRSAGRRALSWPRSSRTCADDRRPGGQFAGRPRRPACRRARRSAPRRSDRGLPGRTPVWPVAHAPGGIQPVARPHPAGVRAAAGAGFARPAVCATAVRGLLSQGQADRELVRRYASHWSGMPDTARLWSDLARSIATSRPWCARPPSPNRSC